MIKHSDLQIACLGDSDRWVAPVADAIETRKPLLVFPRTGAILALNNNLDLLDLELSRNDLDDLLYIGHPHGEILIPFAIAARQRLWDLERNGVSLTHIDAHPDHRNRVARKLPLSSPTYTSFDREHFDANTSRSKMVRFIDSSGPSVNKSFEEFVEIVSGDIETFICTLASYVNNLSACIRPENQERVYTYRHNAHYILPISSNDLPVRDYRGFHIDRRFIDQDKVSIHEGLQTVLQGSENNNTFFSIDGDFCGVVREGYSFSPEQMDSRFNNFLDALLLHLNARTHHLRSIPAHARPKCLWGLSVDNAWCYRSVDFIIRFLREFYLPFLRTIPFAC